jgi:glycogen debranching enzyme
LKHQIRRRSFIAGAGAALYSFSASNIFALISKADPTAQPDRNQLTAQLQQLLVSDDPKLYAFATEVYATCVLGKIRPPDAPLMHAWIVPGGGYYAQWLWDTMFVVDLLSLMPGQEQIIRGVFQNYWDFQRRWNEAKPAFMHGMIANFIAPYNGTAPRDGKKWREFPAYSQAPLLAWGMERVYKRNHDMELLRAGIGPLERFHDWYWRERDIRGIGLVGVGSYDGDTQDARYETYDKEVDLDDLKMISYPGRAAGPDNDKWYGDIAIPANTAYLLASELALARMARLCGNHAMAQRRNERYAKGVAAVREHMWDESAGSFLAVRIETMDKIRRSTLGGFMPVMGQIATPAQATAMAKSLATPAWATPLPIPSVARTAPQFQPGEFWRGDVWPAPNYQVAGGLADFGLRDASTRIADATVANALKAGISERYDSLSGRPLGVAGLGMSATMLTMMLDGLTSERYKIRVRDTHAG